MIPLRTLYLGRVARLAAPNGTMLTRASLTKFNHAPARTMSTGLNHNFTNQVTGPTAPFGTPARVTAPARSLFTDTTHSCAKCDKAARTLTQTYV